MRQTGDFAWNLVTRPLAKAMNTRCAAVPPAVSEFVLAGLTPAPSQVISAPRVAESPVSFECRVTQIVQLQGANGAPVEAWLTLGEVVAVHIDKCLLLTDGVYHTAAAHRRCAAAGRRNCSACADRRRERQRQPGYAGG